MIKLTPEPSHSINNLSKHLINYKHNVRYGVRKENSCMSMRLQSLTALAHFQVQFAKKKPKQANTQACSGENRFQNSSKNPLILFQETFHNNCGQKKWKYFGLVKCKLQKTIKFEVRPSFAFKVRIFVLINGKQVTVYPKK